MNEFVSCLRYATGFASSKNRFARHKSVCVSPVIRYGICESPNETSGTQIASGIPVSPNCGLSPQASDLNKGTIDKPVEFEGFHGKNAQIDPLRSEIDAIVAEIKGEEVVA